MDASALANAESWLSWLAFAKLVAAALVAAGVVIEFGGDWVARPFEKIVKEAREKELAALRNDTERLRGANLALEIELRKLGPRILKREGFIAAVRDVPVTPVKIMYVPDDFDSMALAQDLQLAIGAAGRELPTREPIPKLWDWTGPLAMSVDGQPTGVTVVAAGDMPSAITDAWQKALGIGLGKTAAHFGGPHCAT